MARQPPLAIRWLLTGLLVPACAPPQRPQRPAASSSSAASAATAPETAPPETRLPTYARPLRYDLALSLDPRQDGFTGLMKIDVALTAPRPSIWLHAQGLTIADARVRTGATERAIAAQPIGEDLLLLRFDPPLPAGEATISLRYSGAIDPVRSQGIYRQSEGGASYAYTYFEPIDARRAFPCFDEPGYKVPWRLTLHVPRGHQALFNTKVASQTEDATGRTVVFAETPPLPSYLIAFLVGPFEVVDAGTAGRHGTPLRFAVPRGRGGELGYARQVTPRVVGLLEDYFGTPYPYGKLDVAVVPRMAGTMEHPGLVAMGQPLTLIRPDERSVAREQDYANTALHELAHYWFGDLVTAAWWDDTWLNEALASWADHKLTAELEPGWRYHLTRLEAALEAMEADSLVTAQKVRQEIRSRGEITNSFDGEITYEKGAALLHMFERWLGPERFRAGIRRYLSAHAHGSATAADFLRDVFTGDDVPLRAAFATFLDQPGVPLLDVGLRCAGGGALLQLAQRRFFPAGSSGAAPQTWHIPLCVRYGDGPATGRRCTLLTAPSAELALPGCPRWVMANEDAAGYFLTRYSPALRACLREVDGQLSLTERISLLADTRALVQRGDLQLGEELAAVARLARDPDPRLARGSLELVSLLDPHLVPDELLPSYSAFVRETYGPRARSLGLRERAGEDADTRLLRPLLLRIVGRDGEDPETVAAARRLALQHLRDPGSVAADLVPEVLAIAAGRGDRRLFDQIVGAARKARDRHERVRLLTALGRFRDPALATAALALLLGPAFDLRDAEGILWGVLGQRETRDLGYRFVKEHFADLAARLRADEVLVLFNVPSVFCEAAGRDDAAAFFTPRAAAHDGAQRQLAQALEGASLCIALRDRQAAGVARFLRR